jgi:hypothetical protein
MIGSAASITDAAVEVEVELDVVPAPALEVAGAVAQAARFSATPAVKTTRAKNKKEFFIK